eukprot:1456230-Pleurochrysis_carterae.AAC.1
MAAAVEYRAISRQVSKPWRARYGGLQQAIHLFTSVKAPSLDGPTFPGGSDKQRLARSRGLAYQ